MNNYLDLSIKEINEKFEFTSDDEHTINLAESAIIGNEIYVTLDYGVHYSQEDIGWRYAYKRQKQFVLNIIQIQKK